MLIQKVINPKRVKEFLLKMGFKKKKTTVELAAVFVRA